MHADDASILAAPVAAPVPTPVPVLEPLLPVDQIHLQHVQICSTTILLQMLLGARTTISTHDKG